MKKPSRKRTDINVEIGNRLKRLRKKNNLSVDELAEAFGIVRDSYTRIENGTTGLSGEYAYILATKYKFDMNYLIGGFVDEKTCYQIESQIKENGGGGGRRGGGAGGGQLAWPVFFVYS